MKKERVTAGRKIKRYIKPTTPGKCPYCGNKVSALESHIRSRHKNAKLPKKRK